MNSQITTPCVLIAAAIIWMSALSMAAYDAPIAKPGCPEKCGNVSISYPFGIGRKCYLDTSFEIICSSSDIHSATPFLRSFNLEVEEITLNNDYNMNEESQRITVKIPVEKSCGIQNANISSLDFGRSPYWFSEAENVFIVSGCGSTAVLRNRNNVSQGGCSSLCVNQPHVIDHNDKLVIASCIGIGCCRINISESLPLDFYHLSIFNFFMGSFHNCTSTMLVSETYFNEVHVDPSDAFQLSAAPTVLGWMVANSTGIAMPLSGDKKRHCQNYNYTAKVGEGIICFCESGYFGNPYIHDGCQGNKDYK